MNRNVPQAARVLGVDVQQVKAWAWAFRDSLSRQGNPGKGRPRTFTDLDLLAPIYVYMGSAGRPRNRAYACNRRERGTGAGEPRYLRSPLAPSGSRRPRSPSVVSGQTPTSVCRGHHANEFGEDTASGDHGSRCHRLLFLKRDMHAQLAGRDG